MATCYCCTRYVSSHNHDYLLLYTLRIVELFVTAARTAARGLPRSVCIGASFGFDVVEGTASGSKVNAGKHNTACRLCRGCCQIMALCN